MTQRSFFLITSILFLLIALLHAVRLLQGWQVTIGGAVVPIWISWIGLAIAAFLAYEGFRLSRANYAEWLHSGRRFPNPSQVSAFGLLTIRPEFQMRHVRC